MAGHTDAYIGLLSGIIHWYLGNPLDVVLNGVGNVWDDLDWEESTHALSLHIATGVTRFAEVVSSPLFLEHSRVDLSGGYVALAGQLDAEISWSGESIAVPKWLKQGLGQGNLPFIVAQI